MNALEYGRSTCPEKLLPSLEKLGDGFHGEAYLIPDDKVIKYSLVYQSMIDEPVTKFYLDLEKVLKYQQKNDYPCFVKVLDFNLLSFDNKDLKYGKEDVIFYQTTMERLSPVSIDEKRVLKTIVKSHRDLNKTWNQIIISVRDQSYWLDFDVEKMISFIYFLDDAPIIHHDMSSSNIMKDKNGNFKLIDLDFSRLKD